MASPLHLSRMRGCIVEYALVSEEGATRTLAETLTLMGRALVLHVMRNRRLL